MDVPSIVLLAVGDPLGAVGGVVPLRHGSLRLRREEMLWKL